jgi:hypothetical protein
VVVLSMSCWASRRKFLAHAPCKSGLQRWLLTACVCILWHQLLQCAAVHKQGGSFVVDSLCKAQRAQYDDDAIMTSHCSWG